MRHFAAINLGIPAQDVETSAAGDPVEGMGARFGDTPGSLVTVDRNQAELWAVCFRLFEAIERGPMDVAADTDTFGDGLGKGRTVGFEIVDPLSLMSAEDLVAGATSRSSRTASRPSACLPRPSAIFAANDKMATGTIVGLKAAGLRVPGDVSVVGFDHIDFADAYDLPLTTVRQPPRDMGRIAMRFLLDLLDQRRPAREEVVLKHEVIVRASSGPPRA